VNQSQKREKSHRAESFKLDFYFVCLLQTRQGKQKRGKIYMCNVFLVAFCDEMLGNQKVA